MSEKGYGIIRFSYNLALELLPEAKLEDTTVQRELRATGDLAAIKERLMLPESYELLGIYVEPYHLCWTLLVQSPEIPIVAEGAVLPHCTPIYTQTPNSDGTYTRAFKRIDIERYDRVLKVD